MPSNIDMGQQDQTRRITPTLFAGTSLATFMSFWIIIPLVFMLIKSSGIRFSVEKLSSDLVHILSFVFPKIQREYNHIVSVNNSSNGMMYLLFYLSLFLFSIFLFLRMIYDYAKTSIIVTRPGWNEIKIILLLLPGAIFGAVFDDIAPNPRPFWDFYIDQYGFYYIRKTAFFWGFAMIIYVFLASILVIVTRSAPKR